MTRREALKKAKRSVFKGWAVIRPSEDIGTLYWWAFDVFRTRKEAMRCKSPDETIKRVEVSLT